MGNRLLRLAFLSLPALGSAAALVTACGDDDTVVSTPDASADATTDTYVPPAPDAGADTGPTDAGADAAQDADAALPPLCQTYPNVDVVGKADASEPTAARYELIALRALHSGLECADNSCEVSGLFATAFDPPTVYQCLGTQLAALAGCTNSGVPINYELANDTDNGAPCVVDGGPGNIQLGFRDPPGTYTGNDVGFVAELVKKAAIATGLSAADAERLKQLYLSQRASVLGPDAGTGDAGFSSSSCP